MNYNELDASHHQLSAHFGDMQEDDYALVRRSTWPTRGFRQPRRLRVRKAR